MKRIPSFHYRQTFGRSEFSQFCIDMLCLVVGILYAGLYLIALGVIVYVAFGLI